MILTLKKALPWQDTRFAASQRRSWRRSGLQPTAHDWTWPRTRGQEPGSELTGDGFEFGGAYSLQVRFADPRGERESIFALAHQYSMPFSRVNSRQLAIEQSVAQRLVHHDGCAVLATEW